MPWQIFPLKFPWFQRKTDDSPHLQTCPKDTNLPHRKVAAIQTCPKYKLAPLFVYGEYSSCMVRVGCILSSIECVYPALQVMVLVNKRRDRSMLCVLSHVNMPLSYIDLLLLKAYSGWPGCIEVLFFTIFIINNFFLKNGCNKRL